MAYKKGFNQYKIIDDKNIAIIYLENRKKEIVETIIDLNDLDRLIELNYHWHSRWIKPMNSYYAGTTFYKGIINGKPKHKSVELQTVILDTIAIDGIHIDHINHNTLDNRKDNLRITVASKNTKNRGRINSNNTTGYRNVCFFDGWYLVQLQINGKNTVVYKSKNVDDAGKVAKEMRQKYYGEFAGE
jgi:hypothetical protein